MTLKNTRFSGCSPFVKVTAVYVTETGKPTVVAVSNEISSDF
jgi:hypothetical protein